eukprot:Gb_01368 [translate_table: standard]
MGYGENVKGYKLWDPIALKMVYFNDVIFKELRAFLDVEQPQEKPKKTVHFETKVEPQEDAHVEQAQGDAYAEQLHDGQEEEGEGSEESSIEKQPE